jgi:hypothetical protein
MIARVVVKVRRSGEEVKVKRRRKFMEGEDGVL